MAWLTLWLIKTVTNLSKIWRYESLWTQFECPARSQCRPPCPSRWPGAAGSPSVCQSCRAGSDNVPDPTLQAKQKTGDPAQQNDKKNNNPTCKIYSQ